MFITILNGHIERQGEKPDVIVKGEMIVQIDIMEHTFGQSLHEDIHSVVNVKSDRSVV